MYYVYKHLDPRTKEVFYIGKGTKRRAYEEPSRNRAWCHKVRILRELGLIYAVEIAHVCETEGLALKLELEEIRNHIARNAPLTNIALVEVRKTLEMAEIDKKCREIGRAVQAAREERGLSVLRLSKMAGLDRRVVAKIEDGESSAYEMSSLLKILNILGMSFCSVFYENIRTL